MPQAEAVSDSAEELPDETDAEERLDSGWEAPSVAEDVRRPEAEDIGGVTIAVVTSWTVSRVTEGAPAGDRKARQDRVSRRLG